MNRNNHRHRRAQRPDRAEVQRYRPMTLGDMVTKERAALPCGCCMFVGRRRDNRNATTAAQPCSVEHTMITERANELLMASLATPVKRPLVQVCAEFLSRAAREIL